MDSRLRESYNTQQLLRLLRSRYGLNPLGIKRVLMISTKRFNELKDGDKLNEREATRLNSVFNELSGRFIYKDEGF